MKIVYEHGNFGYIREIADDKYELIVNVNTYGLSAGYTSSLDAGMRCMTRLARYPERAINFLEGKNHENSPTNAQRATSA